MKCERCGEWMMKTGEAVAEFHPLDGSDHKNVIWDVYTCKNQRCTCYNKPIISKEYRMAEIQKK
jgi:hypothetical protein